MAKISKSSKLQNVCYDIRGPVLREATRLEDEGHRVLKLNIGNPAAFDMLTPDEILQDVIRNLPEAQGYCDSKGLYSARKAIMQDFQLRGVHSVEVDDIYLGNGVSELIVMAMQGLLNNGDEVLVPAPDYPLWSAAVSLCGGTPVHYVCDEQADWQPDIADIKNKVSDKTRAIVVINPNNPTGNVANSDEIDRMISIAEKWPNCMIVADEIYDELDFTDTQTSVASRSQSVPIFVLNGVSKVYYAPGWRIGYMALHDPTNRLGAVRDGIERLLRSRLCASTPAQMGYLAGLTQSRDWMDGYTQNVLAKRDLCLKRISEIDGLEVQRPGGAFYMFVRLTDPHWAEDDKKFVLDLLHSEHVLVVHGSGFSKQMGNGHFRLVYLAEPDVLNEAFDRIERFLQYSR